MQSVEARTTNVSPLTVGPREPRSTVLTVEEEAVVVDLRLNVPSADSAWSYNFLPLIKFWGDFHAGSHRS